MHGVDHTALSVMGGERREKRSYKLAQQQNRFSLESHQNETTYLKASEPDSMRNAAKKANPRKPMVFVLTIIW
jgi:hypothetical protein